MAALSFMSRWDTADTDAADALPQPNPNDWLSLEQAACELGVSTSTVRRRLRRGELRNRIVPRKGGFAYRILIPGSRHGRDLSLHGHAEPASNGHAQATAAKPPTIPHDLAAYRRNRAALAETEERPEEDGALRVLQERVARITDAVRPPRTPLLAPAGIAGAMSPDDPNAPYARYRQLVKRRRWWRL